MADSKTKYLRENLTFVFRKSLHKSITIIITQHRLTDNVVRIGDRYIEINQSFSIETCHGKHPSTISQTIFRCVGSYKTSLLL